MYIKHKGGLVDVHNRSHVLMKPLPGWVYQIESTCREIYIMFNWGKYYEELVQVCANLDIAMKSNKFSNNEVCK